MQHGKNEGEEYIQAIPRLKKWINECNGCHTKGYDPAMPEHISHSEWNLAAHYIKKYFKPQTLDENGFCEQCAKHRK